MSSAAQRDRAGSLRRRRRSPPRLARDRPVLATLEVTNAGLTKGQTFEIHVPLAHVGRGAHNDIVLTDDSVSETHAKLQRRDDGWYVVDAGSTNGTYVGGQRLSAERRLEGAPDVRFGGVKMIFRPTSVPIDGALAGHARHRERRSRAAPTAQRPSPTPASAPPVAASAPATDASRTRAPGVGVGRRRARHRGGRRFLLAESLMVRLLHSARTDVGMIRSGNEDNFAVNANGDRGLFVVADGMGGHAAGEVASEMAVQTLERELGARSKDLADDGAAERVTDALQDGEPQHPRSHDHRGRQAGHGHDGLGADRVRARDT